MTQSCSKLAQLQLNLAENKYMINDYIPLLFGILKSTKKPVPNLLWEDFFLSTNKQVNNGEK